MRHRGLRIVTAGLAMLPIVPWLFASAAVQQAKQNQKATVEVKAAPEKVLPGEKVTINGTTDIDAKTPALTIAVTNTVSHSTVTITATANSEGVFSTVYEKTQTSGKYEVVANSPSGRASGRTFFTVLSPAAIVGDIGGEVQNDVAATRELLEEVSQM